MSTNSRTGARRGPSGAWSRLKSAPSDPLDAYGLPSKGETRLQDPKAQEAFYSKIVERYMKFCAASGTAADLSAAFASLSTPGDGPASGRKITSSSSNPANDNDTSRKPSKPPPNQEAASTSPTSTSDLPNILLAMRKLREAIRAARRTDPFASRAYQFIIRASILVQSWEAYQPALLYLLQHIHRHNPLSPPEQQEFGGYWVLDLACRQYELGEAYAALRKYGLPLRNPPPPPPPPLPAPDSSSSPPQQQQQQQRQGLVRAAVGAVARDDWVRFWRVRRGADGYQRAILDFARERLRRHALKCLGRSYLRADREFVERCCGAPWEELVRAGVGWELLEESGMVVIRKPKPK